MIRYELKENMLTVTDFLRFRELAGWNGVTQKQGEMALKATLLSITVVYQGQVIGIGRLIGDGQIMCYIQDVVVLPEFRNQGIGRAIMQRLIAFVESVGIPHTTVRVGLFSAKGKEGFYENLGFYTRPNHNRGAGMELVVPIRERDV